MKVLKSFIYLIIAGFIIYIMGSLVPRIINVLSTSTTKYFLISVYWITVFCIFAIPQYIVWFTDDDLPLYTPVISIGVLAFSTLCIVAISLATTRMLDNLTLSSFAENSFYMVYWMAVVGTLFVPQYFVYHPLGGE